MKKAVVIMCILFCGASAMAQSFVPANAEIARKEMKQTTLTIMDAGSVSEHSAAPYQTASASGGTNSKRGSEGFIGESFYPRQTNNTWHNRLISLGGGELSVVWPTSLEVGLSSTTASRGTAYNFYDGSSWTGNSSLRIESRRAGWGIIAPLGNGGEIIVSHDPDSALLINKRAVAGTGAWQETKLRGPLLTHGTETSYKLTWPVMTTVGDTVHIFALTESDTGFLYQGINTCLVYYRSTDNGATWDIQHQIVAGLDTCHIKKFTSDHYELTAKPGLIVLVYGDLTSDLFLLKSKDGGTSWNREIVFNNPLNGLDPYRDLYDTTFVPGGGYALAIDDNNSVHLAFVLQRILKNSTNRVNELSFWGYYGTFIVYWNENLPAFGTGRHALSINTLESNGIPLFSRIELTGDHPDSIYIFSNMNFGMHKMMGDVFQPKLITDNGTVYMFYTAVLPYPYYDDNATTYWHGVFATKSTDNGVTWNRDSISWLSYDASLFQIDWQQYREYVTNGADKATAMQSAKYITTENMYPSVCLVGNTFHAVWFNCTTAADTVFPSRNIQQLYYTSLTKDEVGKYKNVREIPEGKWNNYGLCGNTLSISSIYPNPVSDILHIAIASSTTEHATITMTNLIGQTVYSREEAFMAGLNYVGVNVSNFKSGFYMITIRTNTGIVSHKIIVK